MTLATVNFHTACLLTLSTIVSTYAQEHSQYSEAEQNAVDLSSDSPTVLRSDNSHWISHTSKSKFEKAKFDTGIKGFSFCSTWLTGFLIETCEKAKLRVQQEIRNKSYRRRQKSPEKRRKKRQIRDLSETNRNHHHPYQKLSRSKRRLTGRSRTTNKKKYYGIWKRFNTICCNTQCRPQDEEEIFDTCKREHHFRHWFLLKLYRAYSEAGSRNRG